MSRRLRAPALLASSAWLVAFLASVALVGVPTRRGNVLIWVALAILAIGMDRPRATVRSFATTWLPLFGALVAYDLLRGVSDRDPASANTWPQLDVDLWLGGGRTPTEHLQAALWHPASPSWWDYAAWGVYQSHFFVPLLVAVVLWGTRHRLATRYVVGLALLSWMALATYWLYPAQPPWMTARDGLTGETTRIIHAMWQDVGVDRVSRVFETKGSSGSRYSNQVAALPSLHAAFPAFIAVMLLGMRRWLDAVLFAYVLAMGLTLVYTGEHFTFDLALGWLYAACAALVVRSYQVRSPIPGTVHSAPQAAADGGGGIVAADPVASRSRYTSRPHTDDTSS